MDCRIEDPFSLGNFWNSKTTHYGVENLEVKNTFQKMKSEFVF